MCNKKCSWVLAESLLYSLSRLNTGLINLPILLREDKNYLSNDVHVSCKFLQKWCFFLNNWQKRRKKNATIRKSTYICIVKAIVLTTPLSAGSKTLSPLLHLKATSKGRLFRLSPKNHRHIHYHSLRRTGSTLSCCQSFYDKSPGRV